MRSSSLTCLSLGTVDWLVVVIPTFFKHEAKKWGIAVANLAIFRSSLFKFSAIVGISMACQASLRSGGAAKDVSWKTPAAASAYAASWSNAGGPLGPARVGKSHCYWMMSVSCETGHDHWPSSIHHCDCSPAPMFVVSKPHQRLLQYTKD